MMKDLKCSFFSSCSESNIVKCVITLDDFVSLNRDSENEYVANARAIMRGEVVTQGVREFYGDDGKADYKRSFVPAVTVGRCFAPGEDGVIRRSQSSALPSPLVSIDIDKIENDESLSTSVAIRDRLAEHPCCVISSVSISGNVFAFFRVPECVVFEKYEELVKELETWLSIVGLDSGEFDKSVNDSARLRILSYDPDLYVNYEAAEWLPAQELVDSAFKSSPINKLADLFGGIRSGGAGDAQVGAALSALSIATQGRLYGKTFKPKYYPFRAQAAIIGLSGAGKTTLSGPLRDIARELRVQCIRPTSDAALGNSVVENGADYDESRPKDEMWRAMPQPTPIFEIVDEAGTNRGADKRREYAQKLSAFRRELYGDSVQVPSALTRKTPPFAVPVAYTFLQMSTPDEWVRTASKSDASAGDYRRVLEFWYASGGEGAKKDNNGHVSLRAFRAKVREAKEAAADIPRILNILQPLNQRITFYPQSRAELDVVGDDAYYYRDLVCDLCEEYRDLFDCDGNEAAENSSISAFAETVVGGISTACALLRCSESHVPAGSERIEPCDILCAGAIMRGVLETRRNLKYNSSTPYQTEEAAIVDEILSYIGTRSLRKSSIRRKYRGLEKHQKAIDRLIAEGTLVKVIVPGSACEYRRATAEEIEKACEESEKQQTPDFSEEKANYPKCEHYNPTSNNFQTNAHDGEFYVADFSRGKGSYEREQDPGKKRKKLENYWNKFQNDASKKDHGLYVGNRDNAINGLAFSLELAGMWDAEAKSFVHDLAIGAGLSEKDMRRLLRNRLS